MSAERRDLCQFPDRSYLEQVLLPRLATEGPNMLFVGVADYTNHYNQIVGGSVRFVTTDARIDIDEFGSTDFSYDASHPQFPTQLRQGLALNGEDVYQFDTIILNGIFGWGTNTERDVSQTLHNAYDLLRPGGKVLLGWNSPEYPTKIVLSDERLLQMVHEANLRVRTIEGEKVFIGPKMKRWNQQRYPAYQFHRYVLAEKPRQFLNNR